MKSRISSPSKARFEWERPPSPTCWPGRLHSVRVRDDEDNPFLEDFYRDKPGAAFCKLSSTSSCSASSGEWRALDLAAKTDRVIISDYIFEKDKIFASLNLSDTELKVYDQYYEIFAEQVPIPRFSDILAGETGGAAPRNLLTAPSRFLDFVRLYRCHEG